VVICLELGADLHMAQLIPLPLKGRVLIATLYDHIVMYIGLFGHSAFVFHVFIFSCFYVILTVCVVVFLLLTFYCSIQLYSCQSV